MVVTRLQASFQSKPLQTPKTGVFSCSPTRCDGHTFCESVAMGRMTSRPEDMIDLVTSMEPEWPASQYDTLTRNCCHFSDALCVKLGVGHIPRWVMNLASAGDAVVNGGSCCSRGAPPFSTIMSCCGSDAMSNVNLETEVLVDAMPALHATGPDLRDTSRKRPLDARL